MSVLGGDCINRKKLYKDMDKWRETCREQKRRYYEKTQNSRNKGNKYTLEEIKMILDKNYSDTELSQILGRSVKAIQVKRCKLNLESEDLNNE